MSKAKGNYREFKLENGLFVALQEIPVQTVSGRLRVWHGALNERSGEEGIAHFLEHTLVTCGSQKYNPEQADKIRGNFAFNACTNLAKTSFLVDMLAEDTASYLKYVSDLVFNPLFDASRVEEERQRVLRELADEKSNPVFKDNRAYHEALWGKNSPHTYHIMGDEPVVNSASIAALSDFHKRGYHPNNMDLILVGALPRNIEALIRENFGSFKPKTCVKVKLPRNPQLHETFILHTCAPELLNRENPGESSAQLSIGLFAPHITDDDYYAATMLTNILGGDSSSRLFTNLSQRKGLAYRINAQHEGCNSNNNGIISIGGSIRSIDADEAIDTIFEEMAKLRRELVSQDNLDRIKKRFQYFFAKTFETNDGIIDAIELKSDLGLTPEGYLSKIAAVTPKDIRAAAVKYLPKNRQDGKYVLGLRDPLKK